MSKAKVIVKVGDDFFKIAQNVWKIVKGSKGITKSSQGAATNAGRVPKAASQKTVELKSQAANLKLGAQRRQSADALRKLNRESKVKLKKGPLDASTKTGTAGSRTSGTGSRTSGTGGAKKTGPWSTSKSKTSSSTQAQKLRDADVTKGTKINLKNATVGQNVYKAGKKVGNVVREGGKKFIKTNKGKLIALTAATAGVGGYYIGKKIDQSIAGTNGEATTSSGAATTTKPKPPKQPLGPPSVYPPTKKPPTTRVADDDLEAKAPKADPKVAAKLAKPKTFEQKLKAKFVKFRGGEPAFGKKGSDAAWKTEVLNMREGSEGGYTYTDQQNYDKIIAERKELASASKGATKKKRGGVIKRNKGGPVRGVGKALRGYGNNSIYSNKMY